MRRTMGGKEMRGEEEDKKRGGEGGGKGVSRRNEVRTAGATCLCVRWRERERERGQGRKGGEGGERERVTNMGRGKRCAAGVTHLLEKKGKWQISRRVFKRISTL